jgi:hypothetical protein
MRKPASNQGRAIGVHHVRCAAREVPAPACRELCGIPSGERSDLAKQTWLGTLTAKALLATMTLVTPNSVEEVFCSMLWTSIGPSIAGRGNDWLY